MSSSQTESDYIDDLISRLQQRKAKLNTGILRHTVNPEYVKCAGHTDVGQEADELLSLGGCSGPAPVEVKMSFKSIKGLKDKVCAMDPLDFSGIRRELAAFEFINIFEMGFIYELFEMFKHIQKARDTTDPRGCPMCGQGFTGVVHFKREPDVIVNPESTDLCNECRNKIPANIYTRTA